jgi:TRAP-type C4-dicarboxylate transport system substrate-binding protein
MKRWKSVFVLILASAALSLPGAVSSPRANAAETTIIRFASLAPSGSAFMKVMKAWDRTLKKETEGRVEIRFYSGGSQGDERDFIRKIRAGQMDAAGVSTVGLGMIVRPVLVLSTPGIITEYAQLERARDALTDRFEKLFDEAGFVLLAWGNAGKTRIFSSESFERPADLKALRPWAWKDDPIFDQYLKVIGANPVRVGVGEVYPGLQTRMIDTAPASAITAVALQWYTRLNYVTKQNISIIVGGSIIDKKVFNKISAEDQKLFIESAERAARALDKIVMRDDDSSYDTLVKRGLKEVDMTPHQAEWDAVAAKTREDLVNRVYSKSLLQAVELAAKN